MRSFGKCVLALIVLICFILLTIADANKRQREDAQHAATKAAEKATN